MVSLIHSKMEDVIIQSRNWNLKFQLISILSQQNPRLSYNIFLLVGDKRGLGYWKFNNSLINDEQFVSQMSSEIEDYFHEIMGISNPVIRWDFLKFKMRQLCMSYSKQKSRKRKQKRMSLESKLKRLENNITVASMDLE